VGPLASILRNIGKDSIQCRACRLVGNLAKEPCIVEQLHSEKITDAIVSLLVPGSGYSRATQQMAVRALRLVCRYAGMLSIRLVFHCIYSGCLSSQKHCTAQNILISVTFCFLFLGVGPPL
jgi:hypothetical protein